MVVGADRLAAQEGRSPGEPAAGLVGRLERLVFGHRLAVLALAVALTIALVAVAAARTAVNADFTKLMPHGHPYVKNHLAYAAELKGLGNALQVVVESRRGDVYDARYLEALRDLTDELFLLPGVDRAWVRSLWMPSVRWVEVTEEGFRGGPVMPDDYDGSPEAIAELRRNVARAGAIGTLVARDARSSTIFVPLLDRDPVTGQPLDYPALGEQLDSLRRRFEAQGDVTVRVVGFAKLVADLIDGMGQVLRWFGIAAAIAALAIFLYTRCVRSTVAVVACSAAAVAWQLGIVAALGIPLDPFSMLVPFLVFALGVSHGVQKMNGIAQDVARGAHRLDAARRTFRRLFLAGLTALLTDAVGFGVLAVIDVPAIRQLAFTAALGVGALVVTNLVLLPVLLSYIGVSARAAARSGAAETAAAASPARARGGSWGLLGRFTERRWAVRTVVAAALLFAGALGASAGTTVGDVAAGAPELRPSSRYNRDAAFLAGGYDVSTDVFAVIVATRPEACADYRTLVEADRLGWTLRQLPGVRSTVSLADHVRRLTAASFEGNPKWLTLSRDQRVLNQAAHQAIATSRDLVNPGCSVLPVVAHLADHRAETLDRVVAAAEAFAREHGDAERSFVLASGSAGVQAATNAAVRDARWTMTLLVYGAVVLLCFAAFRSWRAALVTVIPLAGTSILCAAFMAWLEIGVTISTLPVIALGVGIPDFALYLLTVQLAAQREGLPLDEAWRRSLGFIGRVVVLASVTLAAGVVTWAWSPIQLQADMGVLLTFMFLGNMVAALTLVPALSRLLLPRVAGQVAPAPGACGLGPAA